MPGLPLTQKDTSRTTLYVHSREDSGSHVEVELLFKFFTESGPDQVAYGGDCPSEGDESSVPSLQGKLLEVHILLRF